MRTNLGLESNDAVAAAHNYIKSVAAQEFLLTHPRVNPGSLPHKG